MDAQTFNNFFKPYAQNVDNAENSSFWKLSREIITHIIKNNIPTDLDKNKTILDAGGGTAKWSIILSKIYKCNFINYDLSEDMLAVAQKNIIKHSLDSKISNIHGNICDMKKIKDNSIDHIISIYSPLSFIYESEKAADELFRILKPNGKLIIMAHSLYNAISSKINNSQASITELEKLEKSDIVKWAEYVPELITYSQESITKLLSKANFQMIDIHGVPVFTQPGQEDFDPTNEKESEISKALNSKKYFNKIFELEIKYSNKSNLVDRGTNIIAIAQKPI